MFVPVSAPFRAARNVVRHLQKVSGVPFTEVWVDAPLEGASGPT
jgi:hypothetical protein